MKVLHRMRLHKIKVQSLAFSPSERYLASIGGQVSVGDIHLSFYTAPKLSYQHIGQCLGGGYSVDDSH